MSSIDPQDPSLKKKVKELKSMNSPQEFEYSYEGLTDHVHLTTRTEFQGDRSKKRVKDKLAKLGLQSFKSEMMNRTK